MESHLKIEMALKNDSPNAVKNDLELGLLNEKPKKDAVKSREVWSHKIEYMLSLIGYTVGLGSVWRFPYLCMRNGGGAFLVPFVFFMLFCGFPLYFLELALGQFSGKSPLVVWCICPLFKGIGYCSVIISFIGTWYYGIVMAWILCYLFYSFYSTQPWSTCDNPWNTPNCISSRTRHILYGNKTTYINDTTVPSVQSNQSLDYHPTAANEFWRFRILNESSGLEDWGGIQWHMVLALFFSFATCFVCIIKGVKSVGKVVYVSAVLPYILLGILLVNNLTLDGAVDGVVYLLKPDFGKLFNYQVWVEAALQVFYSLGPAWGGVITMASYSKFNNKCLSDAAIVSFMDCFSAILCGLTVFTAIGFLAHEAGSTIPEIAESGPGLVFQAYPEALTKLPIPHLWAVLFFVVLFTVGLDSQFGMLETIISGLTDMFPKRLGKRKTLLVFAIFALYMSTGLIFATQAGVYIFQLIDWYASIFVIFMTSLLECVVVGYLYGAERFSRDVEMMVGRSIPIYVRISFCILTPSAMVLALIATLVNYQHPTYKGYVYPQYISVIGMMIALVSVVPVPILAVKQLFTSSGSLKQRVKVLIKPSKSWGPNDADAKAGYKIFQYEDTFLKKLKQDLTGCE